LLYYEYYLLFVKGHTVSVRLKTGKILSGIFHQLNDGSIILKMCREKDEILTYPKEEEIISSNDFLELKLDKLFLSINQGSFLTDSEISSNTKSQTTGPRFLQPWISDETISMDELTKPLDDTEDSNFDQFKHIESTYSEHLYNTPVDRNSRAYLDNVEKYEEMESKMKQEQTDNQHIAEERGQEIDDDSEERFTTVSRPTNNINDEDYMQEIDMGNTKPQNLENNLTKLNKNVKND